MTARHDSAAAGGRAGASRQFAFQLGTVPRMARGRPAPAKREAPDVYGAVEVLRQAGRRVYRAGGLHKVDGTLLTTAELLRAAAAIRRRVVGGDA